MVKVPTPQELLGAVRHSRPKPKYTANRFHDDRLTMSENKAVEMRKNGYTTRDIADEMDTSEGSVRVFLHNAKQKGITFPRPYPGPYHDRKGWTTEELAAMKATGKSNSQITQSTGVHPRTLITRMNKWKQGSGSRVQKVKPEDLV